MISVSEKRRNAQWMMRDCLALRSVCAHVCVCCVPICECRWMDEDFRMADDDENNCIRIELKRAASRGDGFSCWLFDGGSFDGGSFVIVKIASFSLCPPCTVLFIIVHLFNSPVVLGWSFGIFFVIISSVGLGNGKLVAFRTFDCIFANFLFSFKCFWMFH